VALGGDVGRGHAGAPLPGAIGAKILRRGPRAVGKTRIDPVLGYGLSGAPGTVGGQIDRAGVQVGEHAGRAATVAGGDGDGVGARFELGGQVDVERSLPRVGDPGRAGQPGAVDPDVDGVVAGDDELRVGDVGRGEGEGAAQVAGGGRGTGDRVTFRIPDPVGAGEGDRGLGLRLGLHLGRGDGAGGVGDEEEGGDGRQRSQDGEGTGHAESP
jgi:hypothetical protein